MVREPDGEDARVEETEEDLEDAHDETGHGGDIRRDRLPLTSVDIEAALVAARLVLR